MSTSELIRSLFFVLMPFVTLHVAACALSSASSLCTSRHDRALVLSRGGANGTFEAGLRFIRKHG